MTELEAEVKTARGENRTILERQFNDVKNRLSDEIMSLKALDPAMGSGHFLVRATERLAEELATNPDIPPPLHGEDIEDVDYWKRRVVERCIYGVDINPLAVELAKVSLWLSTVARNKPLNFLDHHLRCGNSLVGARIAGLGFLAGKTPKMKRLAKRPLQVKPSTIWEHWLIQNVATAVDNFFRISGISSDTIGMIRDKEQLYSVGRQALRRYLQVAHIWTSTYFGNNVAPQNYDSLLSNIRASESEWVQLSNKRWFTEAMKMGEEEFRFFHWELEFPEVFFDRNGQRLPKPGFDAVAGNPPYLQEARDNAELFRLLKKNPFLFSFYEKNIDIFCFFTDISLDLLMEGGIHSFIIPIYWKDRTGCSKMRKKVFGESTLELFIDFDDFPVFAEAPGHHSSIYRLVKMKAKTKQLYLEIEVNTSLPRQAQQASVIYQLETSQPKEGTFRLSQGKLLFTPLGEVDPVDVLESAPHFHLDKRNIMRGVDTSPSDYQGRGVFVLSLGEFNTLLPKLNVKEKEFLKPFYSAEQIDAYSVEPDNVQWLIYTDKERKKKLETCPEDYPQIVTHLERYAEIITSDNKPFGLHRAKDEQSFLNQNKLVFVRKTMYPKFAYCTFPFFSDESIYIVLPRTDEHRQLYMLSIFNSAVFHWWCARHKTQGSQLQIDKEIILGMPVRTINFVTFPSSRRKLVKQGKKLYQEYIKDKDLNRLLAFVDECLPQKSDGTPDLEREQSDVVHDELAFLAEEMTRLHKEKQAEIKGFLTWLGDYLGVSVDEIKNKTRIREYWKANGGWESFLKGLEQNRNTIEIIKGVDITRREPQENIRTEFDNSIAKLTPLLEPIELTGKLIDKIVYKLYGLTQEATDLIEKSLVKVPRADEQVDAS